MTAIVDGRDPADPAATLRHQARQAVAAALGALSDLLPPLERIDLPVRPDPGLQPDALHALLDRVQDMDDRFAADARRCRREDPRAGLTSRLAPALLYLRDAERALLAGNPAGATADLQRALARADDALRLLPRVRQCLEPS